MIEDFLQVNRLDAKIVGLKKKALSEKSLGAAFGVPLHQVIRTTVFLAKENRNTLGEAVIVVFPADHSVSDRKVRDCFPMRIVERASPEEALDCTGYDGNAVPPVSVYGAVTLLDERVLRSNELFGLAGSAMQAIRISPKEIESFAENVIVGDYCESSP